MADGDGRQSRIARSITATGWMCGRPVALDLNGPVGVPFEPFLNEWLEMSLLDVFEIFMTRWSDRVIVDDGRATLSYTGLFNAFNNLSHEIHALLAPGTPILALLRNNRSVPAIMLGAGAALTPLVPVDATAPLERKIALLEASGAGAVLFEAGAEAELDLSFVPEGMPRLAFSMDTMPGMGPLALPIDLDAPAAFAYTSGSTGRPKGIAYSGRHTNALVQRHIAANHINEHDVIAGVASLSAAGLREMLCAVFSGARLCPIDFKNAGMMESLRAMAQEQVTILSFVTSALRALMQLPGIERAFASLRAIDLVGESTTADDIALFRSKLPPDCKISIGLGTTESNVVFRWFVRDEDISGPIVASGYIDEGRCIRIVDEAGDPVAIGEAGELVVSDATLALGYRRGDGIDNSAFRARPGDPGPRTYFTGDIVRMREDGLVQFLGRRDRMVKVRGLQADLGEIEAALKTIDGIDDAVAVPRTASDGSVSLVAFVSMREGAPALALGELRRRVADETAEHMVPSQFRTLEAIPRLHNGKPDLVRLQAAAG